MNWLRGCLLAGVAGICLVNAACALDPARAVSQYVHDKWGASRGFLGGTVYAICQSDDGYLWIGTERGLVRFDGFAFTLIQRPLPDSPPIGAVRGLVSDAEGNLWIRLDGPHLLRYRQGKFEDAAVRNGLEGGAFTAMSIDGEGHLLLWGIESRTVRYRNGKFQSLETSEDMDGIAISVAETRDHKIWLGTRDLGLFRIEQGSLSKVSNRFGDRSINALLPTNNGGLWIGTDAGIEFWDGNALVDKGLPSFLNHLQILALTKDSEGSVWIGTNHGLFRLTPDGAISPDRDSDGEVTTIYQDRDGDIWFGGLRAIENLRDGTFTTYSTAQGLPSESNGPVYVDPEGRTWFAPLSGGLYWLKDGHVGHITSTGLDSDVVYSISGGGGEVWIGRQHGGLTVLTKNADSFAVQTYTQADGLAQNSVYSVHRNRDGTVWAGTVSAGVSRLRGGKFTNYSTANGLASNSVNSIVEGHDGTMWLATPSGLASFAGERWTNHSASNGLPSSDVRSIFEDKKQVLWIATSGGPAYLLSGHIAVPRALPESLREEIFGIAEDKRGFLWLATSDHVLEVDRDRLLTGTLDSSNVQSYGTADGLQSVEGVRRERSVITDPSGRVWISLSRGLAVADPELILRTSAPATVRIESISAGGIQVNLNDSLKFSPGSQSIDFNYASTSLSTPEVGRFRYKLDGYDQDWSHVVTSRQAIYSHLSPGSYRLHIVASSREGLWNGPETTIPFVIEPAFWQTRWFRALCAALCALLLVALYRLRMYHLTRQLNLRFQERLAERTRIAQELHDTLLQGFVSASMQLDVAEDQLPDDSPAKPLLRRVLQLMGRVTEEGRNALRGLRTADTDSRDLELAFSRIWQELAIDEKISYRVIVHSVRRPLRPAIRDEVYRIGREAVANAFLHAQANTVEVELEYASRYLRIMVRDDGCGIDPHVLETGRKGHWGLPGMRERSERIGANLRLRSRIGAGTEVELTIPSAIAFESQSPRPVSQWFTWFNREKFEPQSGERKRERK
ncbi:MAG: putative two-component system sensor kinase [Edaphobacter sp.]|nr:putative two-component system sensor kinase [Edaphobacter sp.]